MNITKAKAKQHKKVQNSEQKPKRREQDDNFDNLSENILFGGKCGILKYIG